MSKEELNTFDYVIDETNYRIFNRDLVYTDMNNDNMPDIFAFSTAFPPNKNYSYDTGRYFFCQIIFHLKHSYQEYLK